jgi:serine/threonine protein kinase
MSEQETRSDEEGESGPLEPQLGELIAGRYRVERLIGRGGMGNVFEVTHVELGRRHAMKFLRSERAASPRALKRFQREAQLLASLCHPAIASVVDFGRHSETRPYMVLEFVPGVTLAQALRDETRFELSRTLDILRQMTSAIAHAHTRGVVHRDLKPDNVMLVTSDPETCVVKILDFGIARALGERGGRLTPSDAELGTPHYMSPEQGRGERAVGPAADIYALGVIFYEMIAGVRPNPGKSYNEVLFHLLVNEPIALAEAAPQCPAEVRYVVERCLARNPVDRYQDGGDLLEALLQLAVPNACGEPGVTRRSRALRQRLSGALFAGGALAALCVWVLAAPQVKPSLNTTSPLSTAARVADEATSREAHNTHFAASNETQPLQGSTVNTAQTSPVPSARARASSLRRTPATPVVAPTAEEKDGIKGAPAATGAPAARALPERFVERNPYM